jgi:hypothetical protein
VINVRISRPVRVGLAVGPGALHAVLPGKQPAGRDGWCCPLAAPDPDGTWPDLSRAIAELRQWLKFDRVVVHVALLPPLVQVKRIELPRLADDILRQVLTRDSARYFPSVNGSQIIAVSGLGSGRRSPRPYLVTAAPAAIVDTVFDAISRTPWRVESVVAAYAAWAAAALRVGPALKRSGDVLVTSDDRLELLRIEGSRLALVRRFRAGEHGRVVEVLGDPDPHCTCAVIGSDSQAAELKESLKARGHHLLSRQHLAGSSALLAAASAGLVPGSQLLPERVCRENRRREARLSARLLAGAAALLCLAAGGEYWGTARELAALRSRRAAIQPNVTRAMTLREEMGDLNGRLQSLVRAEAQRSGWARTLVGVAEYLPADAHLVGFRGDADSLRLEGEARRAAIVFEAIQKTPGVVGVRADAPISQETRDSVPIERFTLAARLAPE